MNGWRRTLVAIGFQTFVELILFLTVSKFGKNVLRIFHSRSFLCGAARGRSDEMAGVYLLRAMFYDVSIPVGWLGWGSSTVSPVVTTLVTETKIFLIEMVDKSRRPNGATPRAPLSGTLSVDVVDREKGWHLRNKNLEIKLYIRQVVLVEFGVVGSA
jgi:hypothetical protein